MDPLTAFGLASNVVSFISFASDLIKTSLEVYSSPSGSPENILSLDSVYSDLSNLSTTLQCTYEYQLPGSEAHVGPPDGIKDAAVAIKWLAEVCKKDCDELLAVTARLQLKDSSGSRRKWKSFRIALRKVWEQKKIEEIEHRLLKTQVELTMRIVTISESFKRSRHEIHDGLQAQSIELQLDQNERLQEVKNSLMSLEHMIRDTQENSELMDRGDVESLDQQFRQLSIAQDLLFNEQRFLSTLQFDARPLRHDAISEAHENTFRWLLDDDVGVNYSPTTAKSEAGTWDRTTLAQWLESKNGIFWVTGKPGCGKSTLIKFIAGAQKTHSILSRWASPVVVAAHYFWNSGSPMQRSQEGLLRSLLYDIFRQHPRLIPVICEEKWRQINNLNDASGFWSLSSLSEALGKISENCAELDLNFCFFIDGLDEFEGDHDGHFQLCQTMCKLAESSHIKMCLSSRPWNVFEEAFGRKPKIYVHELTWNDIRNYAVSRLQEHPRWPEITRSFSGQWLIDEIANRSSGVFLWVFLVTKLLREGMTNRDRFPDLRRRLESFPCELEDFFKQILTSVEPIYHAKTATILEIALAAKEPLEMFIYDFHDFEHDDEDYFVYSPRLPFAGAEESEIFGRMIYHLNSRTRGLLEISSPSAPVTFLHRTVKDYLTTKLFFDFKQKNIPNRPGHEYIPELSILRAYAAWIKRATPQVFQRGDWGQYSAPGPKHTPNGIELGILQLTKKIMPYAAQLDAQQHLKTRLAKILDDIDNSVAAMVLSARTGLGLNNHWAWNPKLLFREHLANGSVTNYVMAKEAKDPVFASDPWSRKRLKRCLEAANSRRLITQPKLFNGGGIMITRPSPTKRRKPNMPNIGRRTGPRAIQRVTDPSEQDARGKPAKRRRQV